MRLTTLHECIHDVNLKGDHPLPTQTQSVTFRIHGDVKDIADEICRTNGVSLSAYLRKCCENLIRDYRDMRPDAQG